MLQKLPPINKIIVLNALQIKKLLPMLFFMLRTKVLTFYFILNFVIFYLKENTINILKVINVVFAANF